MAYAYACTDDKCLKMDYDTSHNPCHSCGNPTEPLYTATDIRKAFEDIARIVEKDGSWLHAEGIRRRMEEW